MLPVTVHAFISAPREEIFEFIADYGARPAWCDHFMSDYRLPPPAAPRGGGGPPPAPRAGRGGGPAAPARPAAPANKPAGGVPRGRAESPRLIVEALHGGRNLK